MPSCRALRVICSAKAGSLPASGPGCGDHGHITVSPNYSADQTLFSYVAVADASAVGTLSTSTASFALSASSAASAAE